MIAFKQNSEPRQGTLKTTLGSHGSKSRSRSGRKKAVVKQDSTINLLSHEERQQLDPKYHSGEKRRRSGGRGGDEREQERDRKAHSRSCSRGSRYYKDKDGPTMSQGSSLRNAVSGVGRHAHILQTNPSEWPHTTDNLA